MSLSEIVKNLPHEPGIYLFYSSKKKLIYVGKATSLKERVRSYFTPKRYARPIEEMIHEVCDIKWKTTDSVLEAVILESLTIKRYQPKYNVMGKDNKSWNYIIITRDEYPRILTMREHEYRQCSPLQRKKEYTAIFGPYPGLNTKAAMKLLRQLFRFSHCLPGTKPCFYYQMGQCVGVCTKEITPREYKQKVIRPLALFLNGKKKQLIHDLEKRMKTAAKHEDFEEASRLRDQLKSLYRIQDVVLLNKSFFEEFQAVSGMIDQKTAPNVYRIEGYDISNLGATGMVGSMVVFTWGEPNKNDYRRFRIRTVQGQSDVDCLEEVLTRRFQHPEWRLPDVILIDGGRPQVNRAKFVLEERGIRIPLVGIAKGSERKRNDFILGSTQRPFIQWVQANRELLIRVRNEAHRFALAYQRKTRQLLKTT